MLLNLGVLAPGENGAADQLVPSVTDHHARQPATFGDGAQLTNNPPTGQQGIDDPQNADLIAVIDRRLGLPISLSIIYVAMARRLGWSAMPLNTPGHVLVRLGDVSDVLIIDPFNDGRIVAPEQVEALLEQMTGQARFSDGMLPLSNRSALVRLLLNQATRAEQAGDPARALVLYDRMTIVAPTHAHGWWERARLQLVAGDVAGARSSLSAMLEITRDDDLRLQVSAALDALPRPTPS